MKKIIASLAFAGILSTGFAGAAHAGPYTGTVPTDTEVTAPVVIRVNKPVKIKVEIDVAGNGKPKGTVTFVVRKPNGKVVKRVTKEYTKGQRFSVGKLAKGKYKVRVKFAPKNKNSAYKKSNSLVKFKVGK
ncbi:hypothetical protein [Nocardioides houyundeii]|uniref:hypothetical protein n=1 Tax=Nocardioides houyundeii TaxID=2045452 RepID=UPI000C76151A|nr:hypothetical protein [Nocardioides houyundeii]